MRIPEVEMPKNFRAALPSLLAWVGLVLMGASVLGEMFFEAPGSPSRSLMVVALLAITILSPYLHCFGGGAFKGVLAARHVLLGRLSFALSLLLALGAYLLLRQDCFGRVDSSAGVHRVCTGFPGVRLLMCAMLLWYAFSMVFGSRFCGPRIGMFMGNPYACMATLIRRRTGRR